MNNEYEKFCRENKEIIDNLLTSLEILYNKFESGIIPGEPEKSDALYMLDVYKGAIESFYKTENPAFRKIASEKKAFDEKLTIKEISGLQESISLLARLSMEKVISKEDLVFQTLAGKALLNNGYCDELIADESGKNYYILSNKAEKALKNKNVISEIRKENISAIIPNGMIMESDNWSSLYFKRVEFLRKYYSEKRENKEYILFTLDDAKEMVFACELNDSEDVKYSFAAVFDEKIDNHISQLVALSKSGLIDSIEIIIESSDMKELLENEGINEKNTPNISIVQK